MCWVYIIHSKKTANYYIGFTKDVNLRLTRHNAGQVRSTRDRRPWEVVYKEGCSSLAEARQRERYIKARKSRKFIESLIAGH